MSIIRLPTYPSSRARKALPASQLATLHQLISSSLLQCLNLPIAKCDISSTLVFLSSYTKDAAGRVLQDLIWSSQSEAADMPSVERIIRHRVLLLAERVAAFLDFQTLLDFAVSYGKKNPKIIKNLFASAFLQNTSSLISELSSEVVPVFTTLLGSTDQGLYGIRKISYILLACLRPSPPEIKRIFARDKTFMIALATVYDSGLSSIAQSYGGLRITDGADREADDWERILLETKVALMDCFHILIRVLFDDIASVPDAGSALAAQCEPAFEVVFSLLELPQPPSRGDSSSTTPTPFLNQSLLADYQHTYDLSRTITPVLKKVGDVRTQLLENDLRSLDSSPGTGNPGALKLLLRSSGIPPGIDHKGRGPSKSAKGKERAAATPIEANPTLDAAVSQVLDILPDQPPHYVRYLLDHSDYPYKGSAERLIEALFEGTAPSVDDVEASMRTEETIVHEHGPAKEEYEYTKDRRNVFDSVEMDATLLRVGKKSDDVTVQDRAFIEQMKADILRRAEAAYEDDDDDDLQDGDVKGKGRDIAFEDDLDEDTGIRVGDGEASDDDSEDSDTGVDKPAPPMNPETILELAYIRDAKLFDRDAQTRRSKARADLKIQTGRTDEQIEGWRIMLERDPNKDKILQKHEFSGNKPLSGMETPPGSSSQSQSRGAGRGRGRGSGRGGGRGRGRGGSGEGGSARDKAWKDRNKASRGNHNRKAGHDKKMARGGGTS